MSWVSAKQAMQFYGIACKKTLSRRRRSGKIESRPKVGGDPNHFEYFIEDGEDEDDVEEVAGESWPGWEQNDAARPKGKDGVEHYFYNRATDRYVFHLDALGGEAFAVDGVTIRNAAQNYSRDGMNSTVAQLCRAHAWSRPVAREILKRLGHQHDSLPFTPETVQEKPEDELVQDMLSLKAQKVHVKAEKAIWRETVKKAEKWDNLNHQVIEPLVEMMRDPSPRPKRKKPKRKTVSCDEVDVFIMPSDLHVGKYGWADEVGADYGIEKTRERLMSAMDDLQEKVARFCKPRRIITGVGSDWYHVDNYAGGTTRGTRQDVDGTTSRMIKEGYELKVDFIERLREIAPVDLYAMGGNHDLVLSYCLLLMMQAHYRHTPDVGVHSSPAARSYTRAGKTLVGISHSEDTKHKDLPSLMCTEQREMWGKTTHGVWFTGHWHADITTEMRGTKVHVIPSLAGTDRWHARNGYVGNNKILPAYVLHHEHGEIAQINGIPRV